MSYKEDFFYKIFSDDQVAYPKAAVCRHIDTIEEFKEKLESEAVMFYIINNKTENVLIFTNTRAYILKLKLFNTITKQSNELTFSLKDFKDNPETLKTEFFDQFDSYGAHDYSIEYPFKDIPMGNWWGGSINTNALKKYTEYDIFALRRIGWAFSRLFLMKEMFVEDQSNIQTKFQFKINKLYTDKTKNNLLYKEFFINKDYDIIAALYNNYYGPSITIQNKYLTYDLDDYKDKDYGILINMDKIKFSKKHLGYSFSKINNTDNFDKNASIHKKSYNELLDFIPYYQAVNIIPDYKNNYVINKLMTKLENNYKKQYNNILKGLKSITEQINNKSILMFTAIGKSRIAFSISDVKRNDLSSIDMYSDRPVFENVMEILNNINDIDQKHWITIDNYNSRIFINKEILKNNKNLYKFSVEKNNSYYQTYVTLIIKSGRRKVVLNNINEKIFDDLCEADCFDEETKNSLKCQYILLKM